VSASLPETSPAQTEGPLGRLSLTRALLLADRQVEAAKVSQDALADEPGNYYELVRRRRIGPEDAPLVARMRAALAAPGLEPAERARVHLALGRAAEDLGEYQEAMRQFDAAEALRDTFAHFDSAAFEARVDRLIARFSPEVIAGAQSGGHDDLRAILIVGLPCSGTTLAEQTLCAYPGMAAGEELDFWNERGGAWEQAQAAVPDTAFLTAAAADYRALLRGIAPGGARVTDRMPLNFQWLGLVHLALPRATIIHCRRSTIDTALSIHRTHFDPRTSVPTGGAALVGYVRAYERLCAHWRCVLPPERFIEIDYEGLVSESHNIIRRIVAACGLTWTAACLSPHQGPRTIRTPTRWQTREPFRRPAVARWRSYEPWLGPLRELLA
jgi:hypothetical protein